MDNENMKFDRIIMGKNIKSLRKEHNLTVERLTEIIETESTNTVYKWQRGESVPTVNHLCVLSDLFKVTINEILGFDMNEK